MNAAATAAKFRSMNGKVERERDAIEAAKRRKEDGAHLCGHGRLLTATLVSVCRWKRRHLPSISTGFFFAYLGVK